VNDQKYEQALTAILQIDDDEYCEAAIEAIIISCVWRVQSDHDLSGTLALRLRREAHERRRSRKIAS
jgi:hypothetical protein